MCGPMFNLEGRVALVTGSTTGLGKAMALHLGRAGAKVAVNYANDRERAEGALAELREQGVTAALFRASVVDAEAESEAAVTAPPQRGFEVSVFPNPTRELLHFQFAAARGGQAQIRIYNTFGQLVRTVQQPCAVGDNTLRIEGLSQTGGGTFFYTLAGPGFQQKGRFSVLPR